MTLENPDLAPVAVGDDVRQHVPVIDLGGIAGMRDPATVARVASDIGDACRDWGFFQIVNHGVDKARIERVWQAVAAFFQLRAPKSGRSTDRATIPGVFSTAS